MLDRTLYYDRFSALPRNLLDKTKHTIQAIDDKATMGYSEDRAPSAKAIEPAEREATAVDTAAR